MQFGIVVILSMVLLAGTSCQKEFSFHESTSVNPQVNNQSEAPSNAILVDASKDGGGWWFPQAGSFSADAPHQSKALADYLRALGFRVTELGRGEKITKELLNNYKYIIRATAFFPYTQEKLTAYESFLHRPVSLLLIADHLLNSPNDGLSIKLGLHFSGAINGMIDHFEPHVITTGSEPISFIGGSVINHPQKDKIVPLGYIHSTNSNNRQVAMGILQHSHAKIFFIGDVNGLQLLPQPFTKNLVKWLFPL